MYVLAIFLFGSFAWLLYETKWLTIRLPAGQLLRREPNPMAEAVVQPQRNRVMEAAIYLLASTTGMKEALIYLLVITAAEVLTVIVQPVLGIVCHIAILISVVVHSAIAREYPYRHLILSLGLIPLIRILSLSMPLANIPQIWWYPIIYFPILVAAVIVMRILDYKAGDIGLNFGVFPVQLAVGLTGFVFGTVEYFILTEEAIATGLVLRETPLLAVLLLPLCTGVVEELIFRGVLQRTAVEVFRWWGIVYISLLFAILHTGFLSWIDVIFVFGVALFFGWVVNKTRSLFGVIVSHSITNLVLYVLIPSFLG